MPAVEMSREKIQEGRVALETPIGSILARLQQVGIGPNLHDAMSRWQEANSKLAQDISIGLRTDILVAKLKELFAIASEIVALAEESTQLDLALEKSNYERLSQDWLENFLDQPLGDNVWDAAQEQNFKFADDIAKLALQLEKLTLSSRDAHAKLKSLDDQIKIEIHPLQVRYQSAVDAFDRVEPELQKRAAKLDELIRLQGQKVLAGRYEVDADNEEKAANRFRYATLGVMVAVILLIALSYYELAEFTLNPVQAAIRIAFSFILSVPAAYLARESSKHRQRQYVLRQTALEIGAIDSYIQTLPPDTQNKIKEEIAIKLFTPQKLEGFDKDSFPINAQELLSKLIDVVGDLKKEVKGKKDKKNEE